MEDNIEQIKYLLQLTTLSDRVKVLSYLASDLETMLSEGESIIASLAKPEESVVEEKTTEAAPSNLFDDKTEVTYNEAGFPSQIVPTQPFLGEIRMVSFNFAPKNWASCNGQLLPIAQNNALFSLLGTNYGGNGQTTFALPNFQGRVPIHQGRGLGLSEYAHGQTGGQENVTLSAREIPVHNHFLPTGKEDISGDGSNTSEAVNFVSCGKGSIETKYSIQTYPEGGSQPHENMQPYLVCNFIIALEGIYPERY